MPRIAINTADIALLQNCSSRYARKILAEIRKHYGKSKTQMITYSEYANYHKIDLADVYHGLSAELPKHLRKKEAAAP